MGRKKAGEGSQEEGRGDRAKKGRGGKRGVGGRG